jgi:hypothetical protein
MPIIIYKKRILLIYNYPSNAVSTA